MGLSSGNSLASLAEGGGASGVSASQVSTIIQAQNEYEFITTINQEANVGEWLITAGLDHTKYRAHKYIITRGEFYSNNYLSWHLLQPDGATRWSYGGSWYSRRATTGSTSASSITTNSQLYFDSQSRSSGWNIYAEIEVIDDLHQNTATSDNYIHVFTRTGMGRTGGYWTGVTDGHAYMTKQNADTKYGGISLRQDLKLLTVHIFGLRRR